MAAQGNGTNVGEPPRPGMVRTPDGHGWMMPESGAGRRRRERLAARNRGSQSIGDMVPEVPDVHTTDTGITSPGGATTEVGQAQELVDDIGTEAEDTFQSELGSQEDAQDFAADVEADVDATGERIEGAQDDLDAAKADLDAQIDTTLGELSTLAEDATSEFDRLKDEFSTIGMDALARTDARGIAAAGQVMEGRTAAMQAAVQGIQGNINASIAKIQSDPNLTQAQKASMVAQVKLAGASSMAPAIGETILGFNTLAADVAVSFGGFANDIEGGIVSEMGAFGRAEADVFARATVASREITSQLLGIQANSDTAFATATATLEGIRSQAEMSGNQLLLDNLPNLDDPVLNITNASSAAVILGQDISTRQYERESIGFQQFLTLEILKSNVGTPWSRIADSFLSGGPMGALFQGFSELTNPQPKF